MTGRAGSLGRDAYSLICSRDGVATREIATGSMRYFASDIADADIRVDGDWAAVDPVCKLDARIWGTCRADGVRRPSRDGGCAFLMG